MGNKKRKQSLDVSQVQILAEGVEIDYWNSVPTSSPFVVVVKGEDWQDFVNKVTILFNQDMPDFVALVTSLANRPMADSPDGTWASAGTFPGLVRDLCKMFLR